MAMAAAAVAGAVTADGSGGSGGDDIGGIAPAPCGNCELGVLRCCGLVSREWLGV